MSEEMIEKVARAIVVARGGDPDRCLSGYSWEAGEMGRAEAGPVCHLRVWQDRIPEAKAAIAAYNPNERLREAYEQGFRNGFVEAHVNDVDGFPDEEVVLRKLDGVSMAEGWEAYSG